MSQINYFSFNGQCYYTKQNLTLLDIMIYFNYNSSLLILELNQSVCNKDKWHQTFINNNDKLEVVSIVGGG
uniref:Thiamine biosynthesis protein S n=1 Tax=Cylindrotheca closterium TaxID=2856 RepID=A0A023HB10_9STRA|nr:thiamine biosynthesis protein S [Cylindrotheca closterium]AGH28664.1 thiamine biosynthesis protein S [Cylindrotheca closterium]